MNDILMYRNIDSDTTNQHGQCWAAIKDAMFGIEDVRPRYSNFTTPWEYYTGYDKFVVTPKLRVCNYSHDELCDQRAIDIFNTAKSQNKKIVVFWSGGIDSTLVLSSFVKNLSTSDLNNLVVVLNLTSIIENTEFYTKFIAGKITCCSTLDLKVTNDFLNTHILLTGDPGDGVYGPSTSMYRELVESGQHRLSWKDNVPVLINSIRKYAPNYKPRVQEQIPKEFATWYVDKVCDSLINYGIEGIDTISDWWWWHYFDLKWYHLIWNPIYKHKGSIKESISTKNLQDFLTNTYFNTEEFQLWSYSNLNYLVPNDIRKHKQYAKKYIFELDHNQDYFDNKLKTPSMPKNEYLVMHYTSTCFDKNWVGYHAQEPGVGDFLRKKLDNYTG